jgi:hypothetical protein
LDFLCATALIENHKLEGVISMPSGVFKPYSGVSTAVMVFTKTGAGGTDQVWFYDMEADGLSLDDKRQAINSTILRLCGDEPRAAGGRRKKRQVRGPLATCSRGWGHRGRRRS